MPHGSHFAPKPALHYEWKESEAYEIEQSLKKINENLSINNMSIDTIELKVWENPMSFRGCYLDIMHARSLKISENSEFVCTLH